MIIDTQFHRAVRIGSLDPGATTILLLDQWPVFLCRVSDDYHAFLNRCTHAGASLEGARVRRGTVMCPLHGAAFRLEDGVCTAKAVNYPALRPFETRIVEDWVEVAIPQMPPTYSELPVAT